MQSPCTMSLVDAQVELGDLRVGPGSNDREAESESCRVIAEITWENLSGCLKERIHVICWCNCHSCYL